MFLIISLILLFSGSLYTTYSYTRSRYLKEMVNEINRVNLEAETKAYAKVQDDLRSRDLLYRIEKGKYANLDAALKKSQEEWHQKETEYINRLKKAQAEYAATQRIFASYAANALVGQEAENLRQRVRFYEGQIASLQTRIQELLLTQGSSTISSNSFTSKELTVLRMLVHPDKHGGSQKANDMFVKINHLLT